jgi:DNA-binding GntR family transcriptional regulator
MLTPGPDARSVMIPTTPETIVERLRDRIRDGSLAPGAPLNQVRLAADLGVSRIPLREALRTLSGEGLIVLPPGQQGRVVAHSRRDIVDLYDLRLALEPSLAGDIVDGASPAATRTLRRLAQQMLSADQPPAWSRVNRQFHDQMYALVDRPHTLRVVRQAMGLVEPYSHRYVHTLDGADRASVEHVEMVDAIAAGATGRLEDLIRRHLRGARDALLEAVDEP